MRRAGVLWGSLRGGGNRPAELGRAEAAVGTDNCGLQSGLRGGMCELRGEKFWRQVTAGGRLAGVDQVGAGGLPGGRLREQCAGRVKLVGVAMQCSARTG